LAALDPSTDGEPRKPTIAARLVALTEVLICSGFPTQLALAATLVVLGQPPTGPDGLLRTTYVVALSFADTVVLTGLIVLFLHTHGESVRDLLIGTARPLREAGVGLALAVPSLILAASILAALLRFAPSLHTVEHNPFADLLRTPRDAWIFAVVVVVAGGIREEIQRAFILRRFEVWLGGPTVGLVLSSLAFGAGHLLQGIDTALATGTLGAFWGFVYLRRRSAIAPIVGHSTFNLLEVGQFLLVQR
jgi:membrane protease YdiL (CAAX protease family)